MYGVQDKIKWLSRLDRRIWRNIILTHEDRPEEDFEDYTEDDQDKELLVGSPFDELYIHWLAAQIDWYNMEYEAFNNSNAMCDAVYSAFRNDYNREHMPLETEKVYY